MNFRNIIQALKNPRSPRSVINYICGCDYADPEIRNSLITDRKVALLITIWFESGKALDEFCQPFAALVRELKADPPSLIGGDWDRLEGMVANFLFTKR